VCKQKNLEKLWWEEKHFDHDLMKFIRGKYKIRMIRKKSLENWESGNYVFAKSVLCIYIPKTIEKISKYTCIVSIDSWYMYEIIYIPNVCFN